MHRDAKRFEQQSQSGTWRFIKKFLQVCIILCPIAYLTNPHDYSFLAAYQRKRYGLVGAALTSMAQKTGLVTKHQAFDYYLFTTVFHKKQWYVGMFGTYIELPQFDFQPIEMFKDVWQIPVFEDFVFTPDCLAILMVFVWLLFQVAPLFMWFNFVLSTRNLKQLKIWTLVTSVVSHIHPMNMIINVTSMLSIVGNFDNYTFWEVFFVTGMLAALTSTLGRGMIGMQSTESIGASGAICGLLGKLMAVNPAWEVVVLGKVFNPSQYLWVRLLVEAVLGFLGGSCDCFAMAVGAFLGYNYDLVRDPTKVWNVINYRGVVTI